MMPEEIKQLEKKWYKPVDIRFNAGECANDITRLITEVKCLKAVIEDLENQVEAWKRWGKPEQ